MPANRNVCALNVCALTQLKNCWCLLCLVSAKLTDVYLVGLVMSKSKQGSVMVVCGAAHAVHACEKLKDFYAVDAVVDDGGVCRLELPMVGIQR